MRAQQAKQLTPREHELFVEGVEMFCKENSDESVWQQIANHVKTRDSGEVKAHAMYYLMSLQSRNPDIAVTATTWPQWTQQENEIFEAALANFDDGDPQRWHKIAELLPNKSPTDVQRWYERLLADILEIERGSRRGTNQAVPTPSNSS
uniref:Myb-like domain-containing protein n=1 Tax=Aureoumbra lagunensis TaxID=44058 RepID=A0A7S3K665_9STRA|mmetsp:Transcript_8580/g.13173  ORF Transcript_8580/g.13173 Transcript_8580/m.13173 type:complete len:149 (+) Transcript_8580:32-478(+)